MYNTFLYGVLKFTPSLGLHRLQCGMMVKVRDKGTSGVDECSGECSAEGQLSKTCKNIKS